MHSASSDGASFGRRLAREWHAGWRTILTLLAIIAIADLLIWRISVPYAVEALFDEPAHAATGLIALLAICVSPRLGLALVVAAGSVLIDLDHLPHLFGSTVLEHGIPRPYTHSLGTIIILTLAAVFVRGGAWRAILWVTGLTLALHFVRDMAEPRGPGIALLWPLSDHAFTLGYWAYGALIVAFGTVGILRRRAPASPHTLSAFSRNDPDDAGS